MKRLSVVTVLLCCVLTSRAFSQTSEHLAKGAAALSAPPPQYPLEARRSRWQGSGVYSISIRANGTVRSVEVRKSTGHPVLDQAATVALQQWRFRPGSVKEVRVPLTFVMQDTASQPRARRDLSLSTNVGRRTPHPF
jgi:TonB family protein